MENPTQEWFDQRTGLSGLGTSNDEPQLLPLSRTKKDFLSKMQEDQEFQDLLKIMPHRHEMDVFADMITAIVIWSTILLLTAMNIVVASFEIRRCV